MARRITWNGIRGPIGPVVEIVLFEEYKIPRTHFRRWIQGILSKDTASTRGMATQANLTGREPPEERPLTATTSTFIMHGMTGGTGPYSSIMNSRIDKTRHYK